MKHKFLITLIFIALPIVVSAQSTQNQPPNTQTPTETTAPNSSSQQSQKKVIPASEMQDLILSQTAPSYPHEAKKKRVKGTVVLEAMIDTTGHITDVKVISGPEPLRQASIDAVKTWVYKPYLLNGNPVEVDTQINIVFALGR